MTTVRFDRGLSPGFMEWLTAGDGVELVEAFREHGLDVRIRADYLNAYEGQSSVAKVTWRPGARGPKLELSPKYVGDMAFTAHMTAATAQTPDIGATASRKPWFELVPAAIYAFVQALPQILAKVRADFVKGEGRVEQECVRANLQGTPLLIVDRQIALPGGDKSRLDLLAVSSSVDDPYVAAVELKQGLDNRIQHVPAQTLRYVEMLAPDGKSLRTDIQDACREMCAYSGEVDHSFRAKPITVSGHGDHPGVTLLGSSTSPPSASSSNLRAAS